MLDEHNYVKLIDFGEAKIVDNYETESQVLPTGSSDTLGGRRVSIAAGSSDGKSSYFGRYLGRGSAKKQQSLLKRKGTFVGTPSYTAPEMLENDVSGLFTDLWALGCIIYEMSCGKKMFRGKNNNEIFLKI